MAPLWNYVSILSKEFTPTPIQAYCISLNFFSLSRTEQEIAVYIQAYRIFFLWTLNLLAPSELMSTIWTYEPHCPCPPFAGITALACIHGPSSKTDTAPVLWQNICASHLNLTDTMVCSLLVLHWSIYTQMPWCSIVWWKIFAYWKILFFFVW